jgi:hypothetical protein
MLRIATVMRTSSGYHSHRSGEQVNNSEVFVFIFLLFVYQLSSCCFNDSDLFAIECDYFAFNFEKRRRHELPLQIYT